MKLKDCVDLIPKDTDFYVRVNYRFSANAIIERNIKFSYADVIHANQELRFLNDFDINYITAYQTFDEYDDPESFVCFVLKNTAILAMESVNNA